MKLVYVAHISYSVADIKRLWPSHVIDPVVFLINIVFLWTFAIVHIMYLSDYFVAVIVLCEANVVRNKIKFSICCYIMLLNFIH